MKLTNPFDQKNIIGYIQDVSPNEIKVHFPDSRRMNRFFHYGKSFHGGVVGGYVVIEGESKGFVGKFIKISLPEKERKDLSEENYKNSEFHPIGYIELLFAFDLLTFESEKSINNFPSVGSKVYATNSEFYIGLIGKTKDEFENDKLSIGEDLDTGGLIELSANKIFQRHCAIVGTTGGGKSYTVAKIIEELIKKEGAKVILLDPTGEFSGVGEEDNAETCIFNTNEESENIVFKYGNFEFDDLVGLFRPAGQAQLPMLEESLKILSLMEELKTAYNGTTHTDNRYNGFVFEKKNRDNKEFNKIIAENDFDLSKINIKFLPYQLQLGCVKTGIGSFGPEDSWMLQNVQSLIYRVRGFLYDSSAVKVFDLKKGSTSCITEKIDNFLDQDNLKKLLKINLSNVPEDKRMKEVLVNAIGRKLLKKAKSGTFMEKPLIVFIDEAHMFLNKTIKDEYSIEVELNAFERVAKECRKYGLYLCISTQRPRDIPEGILSQMGTFIVHRLINDKDKQAIENAVSNYNKSFLSFLPSLGKGEALIMGIEFLTTIFLKIQETIYPPKSETPKLFGKK